MNNDTFKPNGNEPNERQLLQLSNMIKHLIFTHRKDDSVVLKTAQLVKEYDIFGDWLDPVVQEAKEEVDALLDEVARIVDDLPYLFWESVGEYTVDRYEWVQDWSEEKLKDEVRKGFLSGYVSNSTCFDHTTLGRVVGDFYEEYVRQFDWYRNTLAIPIKTFTEPKSTWLEKANRKRNVKAASRNYGNARQDARSAITFSDQIYAKIFEERVKYEKQKDIYEKEEEKLTKPLYEYARSRTHRTTYQHKGAERTHVAKQNMHEAEGTISDLLAYEYPDVMPMIEKAEELGELWLSILKHTLKTLEKENKNKPKKRSANSRRNKQRKLANEEPIEISGIVNGNTFHFDLLSVIGKRGSVFEGRHYFLEIEGVVVAVSDLRAWLETLLLAADFNTLQKENTLRRDVDYLRDYGMTYVAGDTPKYITVTGKIEEGEKLVFEYKKEITTVATFLDRSEDLNSTVTKRRGEDICHLAVFDGNGCYTQRNTT